MNGKWKQRIALFWRGWGMSLLIGLLIATTFKSAIADWNYVPSGSMKPTILEGDRIFVNKLAYDLKVPFTTWHLATWDNPKRGDIVVFFSPANGMRLVKRVVGIPGDVIALRDNQLFINGEAVHYGPPDSRIVDQMAPGERAQHLFYSEDMPGKEHAVMFTPSVWSRNSFAQITIPKDHYFMMGDNRDNSADSRYFGFVDRSLIVGRVSSVVMSVKPDDHYLPRWDRFFQELS